MNINELNEEARLFALFIGRSGSGKTVAAASLPRPMQELDFDLRGNGLINAVRQGWLDSKDLDIKQFDPFKGWIPIQEHLNLLYTLANTKQLNLKSLDIGSGTSLIRLLDLTAITLPAGSGIGHLNLGGLSMTGFADFKFESQAIHRVMDFLRVLPVNVTMSAHIIDKYGKRAGAKDSDPQTIIGEKLTLGTANISENVLAMFNDVYKFTKEMIGNEDHYFVEFNTEIARNSFGIPPGKHDITRKTFWEYLQTLIKSIKDGTFKKSNQQATGVFQI